ncbi:MAG: hypothetical protein ACFUZC_04110 [Chthoniobacteraceae bacterium]
MTSQEYAYGPADMDVSNLSFLKRGKDVLATAEAELAKAISPPPPIYRFHLLAGRETDVIILDSSFDEAVGLYEHNIQRADGSWGNYIGCTRKNCSACERHGESYYVIFLTILDLRSYVDKTGKTIPFTKMLLPIKLSILPRFHAIASVAMKKAGTLRGTQVKARRESRFSPTTWRFSKVSTKRRS